MDMSLLSTRRTSSDKAKSLQPNGICGRFDKTILSEFQKLPFGKNMQTKRKYDKSLDNVIISAESQSLEVVNSNLFATILQCWNSTLGPYKFHGDFSETMEQLLMMDLKNPSFGDGGKSYCKNRPGRSSSSLKIASGACSCITAISGYGAFPSAFSFCDTGSGHFRKPFQQRKACFSRAVTDP